MKFRMGTFEQYFRERLHFNPLKSVVVGCHPFAVSHCFIIMLNILNLIFH